MDTLIDIKKDIDPVLKVKFSFYWSIDYYDADPSSQTTFYGYYKITFFI